jgi:heme exporter protein C
LNPLVLLYHKLGSPEYFYRLSGRLLPWILMLTVLLTAVGLYGGLTAPADYQQGHSAKIIYVHVPAAWMSLLIFVMMALFGVLAVVWRTKMAEWLLLASAPIGASYTLITLVTGSLWAKPTWGTYWVWDVRLTTELILLFLYLGVIATAYAFEDRRQGARHAAIVAIVGVINVPIVYYSVRWWNSLHQTQSITTQGSDIHMSMLWPLLVLAIATKCHYGLVLLLEVRKLLLQDEGHKRWVQDQLDAAHA